LLGRPSLTCEPGPFGFLRVARFRSKKSMKWN
jgi:hypothetical protein